MNKVKRSGIVIGVFIVLGVVIFFVLLSPAITDLINQRRNVAKLSSQISKKFLQQPISLKKETEFIASKQEASRINQAAFISKDNQLDFVLFLESLSTDFPEYHIDFSPDKREVVDGRTTTSLVIELESSLLQLVDYIAKLERSDYYIVIDSIEIESVRTGAVVTARINAYLFLSP